MGLKQDNSDSETIWTTISEASKFVQQDGTITTLRFSSSDRFLPHFREVIDLLDCSKNLQNIDLSNGYGKGDDLIEYLSKALISPKQKITTVNLSGNNLSQNGIKHLCKALNHTNCLITDLDLSRNDISNTSTQEIYSALVSRESISPLVSLKGVKLNKSPNLPAALLGKDNITILRTMQAKALLICNRDGLLPLDWVLENEIGLETIPDILAAHPEEAKKTDVSMVD